MCGTTDVDPEIIGLETALVVTEPVVEHHHQSVVTTATNLVTLPATALLQARTRGQRAYDSVEIAGRVATSETTSVDPYLLNMCPEVNFS